MIIVTAGSDNYPYWKTITYCADKAREFRYKFVVYDLGGLGFGEKVQDHRCTSIFRLPKICMKPELILRTMEENPDENDIAWVDGDATILKPLVDIENDSSFDLGFTVRPKRNRKKTQYINAGIVFVKNSETSRKFVKRWIDAIPKIELHPTIKPPAGYCDQSALEENVLLPVINQPLWDIIGEVRMVHYAKIKFLDCRKFNNMWLHTAAGWGPPGDTVIMHFKEHTMSRIDRYRKEFL